MALRFKPFEPFEVPETETLYGTEVYTDPEGDLVLEGGEGVTHYFSPEQWRLLTERVQVEAAPEPWEKVRDILRPHLGGPGFVLDQVPIEALKEIADLFKSPGA